MPSEVGLALIITTGSTKSERHNKVEEHEDLIRRCTVFTRTRRHLRFARMLPRMKGKIKESMQDLEPCKLLLVFIKARTAWCAYLANFSCHFSALGARRQTDGRYYSQDATTSDQEV